MYIFKRSRPLLPSLLGQAPQRLPIPKQQNRYDRREMLELAEIGMDYAESQKCSCSPNSLKKMSFLNNSSRGRVAIFIDGSNLFYAALELGIEVDYSKLLSFLTANSPLLRCFFYTGVDPENEKQQGFLYWLSRHGYRVITKDIVQLPDGSKKGNLDVELAVDLITLVDYYDTAVLVSGDGDLAYAVKVVSYRGVRVEVVGLRSMTSESLLNVADHYIDLDTITEYIQKTPGTSYNIPSSNFNIELDRDSSF